VLGLIKPTAGTVAFGGQSIAAVAPHRVARQGIAVVPEGRQVFGNLSVLETFPRLKERLGHGGQQLSGGEQQMLTIGRALMTNPDVLILDEATEGLAPLVREEVWRVLATLRQAGHAMLVIDKYVHRLIELADRQVILEKGKVVWSGSSAQLDADRSLWSRHLGL
jgi:branched-chain amino acid transport system ATP-binding protein